MHHELWPREEYLHHIVNGKSFCTIDIGHEKSICNMDTVNNGKSIYTIDIVIGKNIRTIDIGQGESTESWTLVIIHTRVL